MQYIFRNLRSFIKCERVIFAIMTLCIFCSSLILNFSYGLYQNYNVMKTEATFELTDFYPEINPDSRLTKRQFQNYVEALSTDTLNKMEVIYAAAEIREFAPKSDYGAFCMRFTLKDGKYNICETTKTSFESNGMLVKGRYITSEEESAGAYVAIIGNNGGYNDATYSIMTGENTIELFGHTYEIIGEHKSNTSCPIVPFLTVDDSIELDAVSFGFTSDITRSMYNELTSTADMIIPGVLTFPELQFPDTESIYLYNNIMLISVLIAVLSGINFAMLYLFVLKKRSRDIAVMRICGCTKGRAVGIYLGECVLMSVPVYAIGTGVYMLLLECVFKDVFPNMKDAYAPEIYAAIFLIYLVVMLLILTVMISRNVSREIMLELKEGKI